jgi:hypothetical protein
MDFRVGCVCKLRDMVQSGELETGRGQACEGVDGGRKSGTPLATACPWRHRSSSHCVSLCGERVSKPMLEFWCQVADWIAKSETASIGRGTHGVDHASDRMNFRRAVASATLYAGIQTLRGAVVSLLVGSQLHPSKPGSARRNTPLILKSWQPSDFRTSWVIHCAICRLVAACRLSIFHRLARDSGSFLKNSCAVGIWGAGTAMNSITFFAAPVVFRV